MMVYLRFIVSRHVLYSIPICSIEDFLITFLTCNISPTIAFSSLNFYPFIVPVLLHVL
uniref:Uncharacterized protein n=1 Tax=Arundo donax TaxID=35708 RepID=A0A0A9AD85_ARUDO